MNQRPQALLLRLAPEEMDALDALSKASGLNRSDTLRQLIRRAASIGGRVPGTRARPRKYASK